MPTFIYKGPEKKLFVLGAELQKDVPFETSDTGVIGILSALGEVEEMKDEKRASRKSDGFKS